VFLVLKLSSSELDISLALFFVFVNTKNRIFLSFFYGHTKNRVV
jgi:hypothetical protein